MNPKQSAFRPRYPLLTRVFIYGPPTIFIILLFMAGSSRILSSKYLWSVIFLLGFITSLLPFFVIREILFVREMVIRRRFLPDQFIDPAVFEGVSSSMILAGRKRIRIGALENLDELSTTARRWSAASKVGFSSVDRMPSSPVYPTTGYGQYASFWGLIFGVISIFLLPDILAVDPRWILGGTFLCTYLVYCYVLPRLI